MLTYYYYSDACVCCEGACALIGGVCVNRGRVHYEGTRTCLVIIKHRIILDLVNHLFL